MNCSGCGSQLSENTSVCLVCGTPAPKRENSSAGLVWDMPDPVKPSGDNWPESDSPTSPYPSGPRRIEAPPPFLGAEYYRALPRAKRRVNITTAIVLFALLAVSLFGAEYYFYTRHNTTNTLSISYPPKQTVLTAYCAKATIPMVTPENAPISSIQLTSGLKDPYTGNYAPMNSKNIFFIGQTIYVTFLVNINNAFNVSAVWCLNNNTVNVGPYNLVIDANKAGIYGYFDLTHVTVTGAAKVIIFYGDQAVAVTPFTIFTVIPQPST